MEQPSEPSVSQSPPRNHEEAYEKTRVIRALNIFNNRKSHWNVLVAGGKSLAPQEII